jgi:hypothetical protein
VKIYKLTTAKFGALVKEFGLAPGSLFPLEFGNQGRIINAMLYDYWHGNGYKLDMLTGSFVEDKTTTPTKGTPQCNPPDSRKET